MHRKGIRAERTVTNKGTDRRRHGDSVEVTRTDQSEDEKSGRTDPSLKFQERVSSNENRSGGTRTDFSADVSAGTNEEKLEI